MAPSPLKICFVSLQARGAFSNDAAAKIGGAEVQMRRLTTYFAQRGDIQPHVIVEDSGQPEREVYAGVTLHRLPQPPERTTAAGRAWRKAISALNLVRMLRSFPADGFVQFCAGAETGLVGWSARRAGAKFVYMLASDSETAPPWSAGGGVSGRLFRAGLARADVIIAQHEAQRGQIKAVFGRNSVVMPSVYAFREPVARPQCGVLWIGRCSREKQPGLLLELARRLPQIPFHLIAKPVPHDPELAAQLAAEAGALPNVTYTPGLPPAQVDAAYAAASLLVNTSDFEGMPNTFLEAAGHGLALLALNVDPGGMFSQEKAGFCAQGSLDRLAEGVTRLHADPSEWAALAARGRSVLAARHALDSVGPAFAELLLRLRA